MKSETLGKNTSGVEVSLVSTQGFWVLLDDRELFLPFSEFPWFADARIRELTRIERPSPEHLYWPDLDVDLHVESIEHPDKFPLIAK